MRRKRLCPSGPRTGRDGDVPWEIMRSCAETGLFGVSIPEAYGGLGGGALENCIVVEELSRGCLGVSVSYAASLLGSHPILLGGSEEQKARFLPDVAKGKRLAAFGRLDNKVIVDVLQGKDLSHHVEKMLIEGPGLAHIRGESSLTPQS